MYLFRKYTFSELKLFNKRIRTAFVQNLCILQLVYIVCAIPVKCNEGEDLSNFENKSEIAAFCTLPFFNSVLLEINFSFEMDE